MTDNNNNNINFDDVEKSTWESSEADRSMSMLVVTEEDEDIRSEDDDDEERNDSLRIYEQYNQSLTHKTYRSSEESVHSGHSRSGHSRGQKSVISFVSKNGETSLSLPVDASVLRMVSVVQNYNHEDEASVDGRKSQLCCFVLCDLVRACVITNAGFMIVVIFYLVVSFLPDSDLAAKFGVVPLTVQEVDSDGYIMDEPSGLDPWTVLGYVKIVGGLVFCGIGIFGALKFQKWLVLSGAIWYLIYACLTFADRKNPRWIGAFLALVFSYPSFHLFAALQGGSITRENYAREKYCCCGASATEPQH